MKHSRISELDGLRGLAACIVLLHHAFPTPLFSAWIVMEGFFCLSGFLITTILLRIDLSQPIAIRNFMVRRTLRIWPVYFLALLSAYLLGVAFEMRQPELYPDLTWWKGIFFLQFSEGYSQLGSSDYLYDYALWFRPTWSLAVEEQYYLLWPVLILLAKGRRAIMLTICVALVVTGFAMRDAGYQLNLLLTRGDGFALGSALAILQESLVKRGANFRRAAVGLYALAFAAGLYVCGEYILTGYLSGAVQSYSDIMKYGDWTRNVFFAALLAMGIIGLLRTGHLAFARRALSNRPLIYMAEISLALYLFQDQVITVVRTLASMLHLPHGVWIELLGMGLSIAAAELSRRVIERPVNRLKRLFPAITPDGQVAEVIQADVVRTRPREDAPAAALPAAI